MNLYDAGVGIGPQNDASFEGKIGSLGQNLLDDDSNSATFWGIKNTLIGFLRGGGDSHNLP